MLLIVFITALVFGCGRVRTSKREQQAKTEPEPHLNIIPTIRNVTRDGVQKMCMSEDLAVGDKISLKTGDNVPCDCLVFYAQGGELSVSEFNVSGDTQNVLKKFVGISQSVNVSEETVLFSQSVITNGNAFAFVLAVGDGSSLAIKAQT